MNAKIYFITGTDTGVGKTVVTAALTAALQQAGLRCLPFKPVQTGSDRDDDLSWCLSRAAGGVTALDPDMLRGYRFPLPASPHLAAARAGTEIDVNAIIGQARSLAAQCDVLLVEGAGGLLVPLTGDVFMIDLIERLPAVPVVVSANRLGTLNHTALTLRELHRRGLAPAAVVVNECTPAASETEQLIRDDNIRRITALAAPAPVLARPYLKDLSREQLIAYGTELAQCLRLQSRD